MNQPTQLVQESRGSLLDAYQPSNSVYFSSPDRVLLAQPPFASLLVNGRQSLVEQVSESLRFARELGLTNAVVVGAIPFDVGQQAHLRVSSNCAFAGHRQHANEDLDLGNCTLTPVPDPHSYMAGVSEALARFARGELDKVVLSRTLQLDCEKAPNVRALVKKLAARNSRGYTFAVNLKDIDNDGRDRSVRALVGASPELLISRRGSRILANPLAGSEPRSDNPALDRQRASDLLHSEKDRREHALVIQAIEAALRPYCRELQVPAEPSLISTSTLWHLSTIIEGELRDPRTSSLELALALHPTPAVCGWPTPAARQAIAEIEGYDRELFTGMVGWCDASGDGEWVVTIRCAQVEDNRVRLYAGAGIVAGSSPEKECAETGAKFNTLLDALGIDRPGGIAE